VSFVEFAFVGVHGVVGPIKYFGVGSIGISVECCGAGRKTDLDFRIVEDWRFHVLSGDDALYLRNLV
jgi:hypothetical protein